MRKEIPAPGLPERGDAAAGAADGYLTVGQYVIRAIEIHVSRV